MFYQNLPVTLAQQEITEEGKRIIENIHKRQEPLKHISSFYQEARKAEVEARGKAEEEERRNAPKPVLSPEQKQIAELTKQLAALNEKLAGKGVIT